MKGSIVRRPDLAIVAPKKAVHILSVQGAVAALKSRHGSCPEVVRAARVTVYARQAIAHPQRHIQRLLQLALQQTAGLLSGKVLDASRASCRLPCSMQQADFRQGK